jgi:L-alanine-DL-glutamate epimerase-like enolase superfamily enzyme
VRIRSVTPLWISLPLTEPLKMANQLIKTADNLLVRIEDTDGNVGWGEASSAPTMTGETPESMLAAVRFMQPQLEGLEVEDVTGFGRRIDGFMYGNAAAKSALDMAAYDLAGKRAKKPVAELLGGIAREKIPVLWMLAANKLGPDVEAAKRMAAEGFVAYKVKIGSAAPEADLERATAVRAALGTGAHISADANQGYSREAALRFARGAEAAGLDFVEQPIAWNDIDGMAAVAAATRVPIGTDEGVHSIEDIEKHHARKAARGASLKTIKLGGLSAVMEAGRRMHALGMHVNLAGKIADSSVASAAIVHLAAALPQVDWDVSITCQYISQDIVREPVRIVGGHAYVPDRPGLGIEIDEGRLSRLAGARLAA